jgi:hypothetical protein
MLAVWSHFINYSSCAREAVFRLSRLNSTQLNSAQQWDSRKSSASRGGLKTLTTGLRTPTANRSQSALSRLKLKFRHYQNKNFVWLWRLTMALVKVLTFYGFVSFLSCSGTMMSKRDSIEIVTHCNDH